MTVNDWSRSASHRFEAVNDKLESQSAIGNIPNRTAMSPFWRAADPGCPQFGR
jgi:hypothetical protein